MSTHDLNMIRILIILSVIIGAAVLLLLLGRGPMERGMLFFPSHRPADKTLAPWTSKGRLIGYSRTVQRPRNVWLMLHGNAGQASDRAYAIPCFAEEDAVFIMEYPGYGDRPGWLSKESFNQAAEEAFLLLKASYPKTPVCVVGESIGSGPASSLAALATPPAKIVLVVPFDQLSLVAKDHFSSLLVSLILSNDWNNVEALSGYQGQVEIFGAIEDTIIPVKHAKALAAGIPNAKLHLIEAGHNEWAFPGRVKFRNP